MTGRASAFAIAILLGLICCGRSIAQVTPTILAIDVENWVSYVDDVFDVTRRAIDQDITIPVASRNFQAAIDIADIVAVNDQPAKGVVAFQSRTVRLVPFSNPGAAISDTGRGSFVTYVYEILNGNGAPIGSIMTSGFGGGGRPPGAPVAVTNGNTAIVGGTGAFLGAQGQAGLMFTPGRDVRFASMTEDPANRRIHGGGRVRYLLHVIPRSRPELVLDGGVPAVAHAGDLTLVSDTAPATPGEELVLFATGLGPTRPGVNPGSPFPDAPQNVVNSPVDVTVNGRPAEVLAAVGVPGTVERYQVSFRVPPETETGVAAVQMIAAWIDAPLVGIPVQ